MGAIETRGLTRYYGDLCAVDHLDLAVREGETLGFLGPNGAGKTTTIRMLTGLIRPTAGAARVAGYDLAAEPLEVKRRVGVVPQRSNLYGELSARDNLVFVAQLYGLPRARWRPRADELLERFGLAERAAAPFAALSGGMKRRLTIAAALLHEPAILFLDEPTTGLDVQAARSIRGLVSTLRASGVTVFLTTHLIAEAEQLADRVAIIVRGRLIALDTPAALCAACDGGTVLELEVPAPSEGLLTALRSLEGVEYVSRSGEVLHVGLNDLLAGVGAVVGAIRAHGGALQAIRSVRPSLEDAFVQLTDLDAEALQTGPGPNRRNGGGR